MNLKEAHLTYALETRWLAPVPLRARTGRGGLRRVDVVEVDTGGWRVDYYLDPDTHLPLKVVNGNSHLDRPAGKMNHEVSLGDYVEVGGVMMPRGLKEAVKGSRVGGEWHLVVEVNPEFDEALFERAPPVGLRPDAWRPKRQ